MPDSGHQSPPNRSLEASAVLMVLAPEELAGLSFTLADQSVLIGRDSDCDFVIPSELVSKSHALVSPISAPEPTVEVDVEGDPLSADGVGADASPESANDGAGYEVADAGSTNGTMVNGGTIDAPTRLRAGDRILVGDVELRFDELGTDEATVIPVTRSERRTVLVSYAAADQPQADRIVDHLRRSGHQVWFDRSANGEGWAGKLLDVVWSCDLALFVVSPASAGSAKVAQEVHLAGAERTPVVAVLVERASLTKDLHWYLTQRQPVDLRQDTSAGLTELAEIVRTTKRKRIARPVMTLAIAMAIFWIFVLAFGAYLALT